MKMLVLGAGLQGCACAYDLLQNPEVTQVTLADLRADSLPPFLAGEWEGRLQTLRRQRLPRAYGSLRDAARIAGAA
jgi:lysine 6-dehydrogenase